MGKNLYARNVSEPKGVGWRIKSYLGPLVWGQDGSLHGEWTTIDEDILLALEDETKDAHKDVKAEVATLRKLWEKDNNIQISISE